MKLKKASMSDALLWLSISFGTALLATGAISGGLSPDAESVPRAILSLIIGFAAAITSVSSAAYAAILSFFANYQVD